ncbi:hypothetical protein [Aeromicrobium choanae]|uniref:LPXTG-motif cell wall anchor domain-containing protein n=1 Tax=Aeromicrobium choanae TaxID=1736691 RepID=A0A1T4Z7L0_9ACTN|nr:hypothetical protein [Aeromicrobium choanae]SKB09926.1 hypothetical protein SAMN06295964_2975 [Aeromicrobium choanae]
MRRLLTVALAVGLLLAGVAPATASDEIGLSSDGVNWVDDLTVPLFDADLRWVPGDSRTVTFYVRNQAESDGELTVTVRANDPDGLLTADHVTLRARANGTWFTLRNGEPSDDLTAASIGAGGIVPVDLQATFSPGSSNASQRDASDVTLELRLTGVLDAVDGTGDAPGTDGAPAAGDSDDLTGWLPQTGAPASLLVLWLAVLVTAVGIAFVAAGRRRDELEESETHE